ncbi:GATA transcription factor [Vigna angularis]|uniref:GATA transcription factor n=1 Tax=Phaseolus angularis TaxID=3914 RepID=A0A8T0JNL3_PHAAN|nr:GATA transcription factor [Vigna angularis]
MEGDGTCDMGNFEEEMGCDMMGWNDHTNELHQIIASLEAGSIFTHIFYDPTKPSMNECCNVICKCQILSSNDPQSLDNDPSNDEGTLGHTKRISCQNAPEYFVGGYFAAGGADQFTQQDKRHADQKIGESFAIDDLLDFSHADAIMSDGFFDNVAGNSTDSSTVTAVDSCNSSISGSDNRFAAAIVPRGYAGDPQFSGELCVPYDDMAELEWLSNFVEDSFSAEEELKTLQLLSGAAASTAIGAKPQTPESSSSTDTLPPFASDETARNAPFLHTETPLPGKARSKRSRAAPGDWSTRLLRLVAPEQERPPQAKDSPVKKREGTNAECSGRKCLHCGAEKTPQWRTGPMGPKTLCNACGAGGEPDIRVDEAFEFASEGFGAEAAEGDTSTAASAIDESEFNFRRIKRWRRVLDPSSSSPSALWARF